MKNILLTGSTGYVGSNLFEALKHNFNVFRTSKDKESRFHLDLSCSKTIYSLNLSNIDIIIHCAGIAHNKSISEKKINLVNGLSMKYFAKVAASKGVKHFIFISSISVYGKEYADYAISENTKPDPKTPYGKSKFKAETFLKEICSKSNMDYTIIRPPMIYGKNAPGNFKKLTRYILSNAPLPLKSSSKNKKNFLYIKNLISFIDLSINNINSRNQIFVICDQELISTKEFCLYIYQAAGLKPKLFYVPKFIFMTIFLVLNKISLYNQLFNNLYIDSNKCLKLMLWVPLYDTKNGLIDTFKN